MHIPNSSNHSMHAWYSCHSSCNCNSLDIDAEPVTRMRSRYTELMAYENDCEMWTSAPASLTHGYLLNLWSSFKRFLSKFRWNKSNAVSTLNYSCCRLLACLLVTFAVILPVINYIFGKERQTIFKYKTEEPIHEADKNYKFLDTDIFHDDCCNSWTDWT